MDFQHHVGLEDFQSLLRVSVPDYEMYFKLLHIFKVQNVLAPKNLMNNFKSVSKSHSRNT